jgi:hypothetical protein
MGAEIRESIIAGDAAIYYWAAERVHRREARGKEGNSLDHTSSSLGPRASRPLRAPSGARDLAKMQDRRGSVRAAGETPAVPVNTVPIKTRIS